MRVKLTNNDIANMYDNHHKSKQPARTLPINRVIDWALRQPNIICEEDYLYLFEED